MTAGGALITSHLVKGRCASVLTRSVLACKQAARRVRLPGRPLTITAGKTLSIAERLCIRTGAQCSLFLRNGHSPMLRCV